MNALDVERIGEREIPRMENLMALNIFNWAELNQDQLDEIGRIMDKDGLADIGDRGLRKAVSDGVITKEQYDEIQDFYEWDASMGGYELAHQADEV